MTFGRAKMINLQPRVVMNRLRGRIDGSEANLTDRICAVLSTFFGLGLIPWAPGTAGTLGAVALVRLLDPAVGTESLFFLFTAGIILLSVPLAGHASAVFGREDPPEVVIDEVCGFCVCMLFVPATPLNLALGFFLFRFFDIAKPFPTRRLESLPGGWGVVMDDVMAGAYSNICLQALVFLAGSLSG